MWKDDNERILNIFNSLDKIIETPTTCPICSKKECHIFFYRHDEKGTRGGAWVWCSHCNHFAHASFQIPAWWRNTPFLPEEILSSDPTLLEENKEMIDNWINKLLTK